MEQYLIDTNVVSDYFTASFSPYGMQTMDIAIDNVPNISVITQIELLCWRTEEGTQLKIKSFINDSVALNISPEVITSCVKLRKGKKIKTPDAIIAATALVHNYTLITNNEKDFAGIPKLKLLNPYNVKT